MKKFLFLIVILSAVSLLPLSVNAAGAPPPPPTGGATPPCWPPPCIPIDGGITMLAIAGAAFAGKKLYDKRKKDSSGNPTI